MKQTFTVHSTITVDSDVKVDKRAIVGVFDRVGRQT
jgi:hypothetical protein